MQVRKRTIKDLMSSHDRCYSNDRHELDKDFRLENPDFKVLVKASDRLIKTGFEGV